MHYFSYFCSKHRLWVLVRTASTRWFYRVPTIYILRSMKNIRGFCLKIFHFLVVKFLLYLNRRVFVMISSRAAHKVVSSQQNILRFLIFSIRVLLSHKTTLHLRLSYKVSVWYLSKCWDILSYLSYLYE